MLPPQWQRHRSNRWLGLLLFLLLGFGLSFVDQHRLSRQRQYITVTCQQLTTALGLSDLALMTEARYTRHPSQADTHAAFQDHPLAFDHFPTGSLIPAPPAPVAVTVSRNPLSESQP
jgi:hypothetical protein